MSLVQYAQDYDGWTPGAVINNVNWPSLIFPYVGGDGVFVCPSGARTMGSMDYVTPVGTYRGTTDHDGSQAIFRKVSNGLSYTQNFILTGVGTSTGTNGWKTANFQGTVASPGAYGPKSGFINAGATVSIGLNEVQVADPAGTIRIFDGMTENNNGADMRGITGEERTDMYPLKTVVKATQRHFEGFNCLFGDGHMKWRKYGSTTPNEWSIQADDPDGTPQ